jgi:hypothetical protein
VKTHRQHAEMLTRELHMIGPSAAGPRVMLHALGGLLERATIVFEAAAEKGLPVPLSPALAAAVLKAAPPLPPSPFDW